MTAYAGKRDRRVIPRWRSTRALRGASEGVPIDAKLPAVELSTDILDRLRHDWESHKAIYIASDLIGAAFTLNRPQRAIDAAEFLLRKGAVVPRPTRELALRLLGTSTLKRGETQSVAPETGAPDVRQKIKELKQRLLANPRNIIARVDMARFYASIGQKKQAEGEIRAALALGKDHRLVLRAGARLFVHLDKPERAQRILLDSSRTKYDPWLAAAEIAVASVAERPSRTLKIGRDMLDSKKFSPAEISELACALGTNEIEKGSAKNAKKLFELGLVDPTDNAIAQAEWASEKLGKGIAIAKHLKAPLTYEARAMDSHNRGEWGVALDQSRLWLADEPFSSRPAILGSFVSAVGLDDFESSVKIARVGLAANPDELTLINNLVFALVNLGRLEDAVTEYERMSQSTLNDVERILFLATGGLIEFRRGNTEKGRHLYRDAIKLASSTKQMRLAASASAFYAREEALISSPIAVSVFEEAERLAKREPSKALEVVLARSKDALKTGRRDNNEKSKRGPPR